jgi:glutathione synthase/RimK-type ligase-like ATP-grasp enzyme
MSPIILVENPKDWKPNYPSGTLYRAQDYLENSGISILKNTLVINLCRNYAYLSIGYYCSLLAEARQHNIIPSIRTITDLSNKAIYSLNLELNDLERMLQKSLKDKTSPFEQYIFFGQSNLPDLQTIAQQIFDLFRCPLLKVIFRQQHNKWEIACIKPISLNTIPIEWQTFFSTALNNYLNKPPRSPKIKNRARYDLAILYNSNEKIPPSNTAALQKFIQAGKKLEINAELIEKKEYSQLTHYDALFIRETTSINHHTYHFSKKAENAGMVVIDDPDSIVKCTNKIYLAELLTSQHIPHPKTIILQKADKYCLDKITIFPIVLKTPDGSFSRGVYKADSLVELKQIISNLFKKHDLILAQEFVYTEYDWRIGILNRKPLFACQYFMSKRHWQVVQYHASGKTTEGGFKTLPIEKAPAEVVHTALQAANLIGDGFYGVDLKQNNRGVFVIEINDNPSIDAGIEDRYLGDTLYQMILNEIIRRLDINHSVPEISFDKTPLPLLNNHTDYLNVFGNHTKEIW